MQHPSKVLVTRVAMEVTVATVAALAGLVVVFGAREFGTGWGDAGPQPGYFPYYIGIIIVVASGGVLVEAIVHARRTAGTAVFLTREQAVRVLAFVGPIAGFVLLAVFLGLYVSLVIYLTAAMVWQGRYRLVHALAVSVGSAAAFYAVFEIWFRVPLLKGPLEAWLHLH